MTTFLLTWNASETGYARTNYRSDIAATAAGRTVRGRWTFGSRRGGTAPGDRVFLLRQRTDRGIVASGTLADGVIFPDAHWTGDPRRLTYYADVLWDHVLPVADRLSLEDLRHDVPGHHWHAVFASGQQVRPPNDRLLDDRWARHLADLSPHSPSGSMLKLSRNTLSGS
ncbi:MAG TPA: hypothetical protein VFH03_26590 [Actinoplanes sp.]|nr:hypothetical protein [Actinoplanes sp.]